MCMLCRSLFVLFLLAIVLSVLLWFTDSDCPVGILWPLCCRSFFDLQILITLLVFCGHCVVCPLIYRFWLPCWYFVAIVLSVLLWFTDSDCPVGILWLLCCLSLFDLQILIALLVSCGHCVVCPSLIYRFWLPCWYLQTILVQFFHWFHL